jgi:hypothetical protein
MDVQKTFVSFASKVGPHYVQSPKNVFNVEQHVSKIANDHRGHYRKGATIVYATQQQKVML